MRRNLLILALLIILATIPFFRSSYLIHIFILFFIWAIIASNWDLLMGYTGIFSLGQLGFFVIGGYTSGIMATSFGVTPWIGMLAGGSFAALTGIGIGLPSLRLKGIYVALLTLAFIELLRIFILSFGLGGVTGGVTGLVNVPPFHIGSFSFEKFHAYYVSFGIFIASVLIIKKILKSPIGLAFVALRDSEKFAMSRGVNAYTCKVLVFMITSFMTGLAGALYIHTYSFMSVENLSWSLLFLALAMIIVGGWGRFPGAILGAFVIIIINEALLSLGIYRLLLVGIIMLVIVLFASSGLITILEIIEKIAKKLAKAADCSV